jgi:hypothetical protein
MTFLYINFNIYKKIILLWNILNLTKIFSKIKPLHKKVRLIEYLSKLDPWNGCAFRSWWLYGNDDAKTEAELVDNRSLFYVSTYDGKPYDKNN